MSNDTVNDLDGRAALLPPELDVSEYLAEMEDFDMTEAQKIEMLETLSSIMRAFVELGFGTDICGQFLENLAQGSEDESEGVKCHSATTTETPSTASGRETSR